MTSGSVEHRGVPVPRVKPWRGTTRPRRLAYTSICAGAVTALVLGPAAAAFANAANPTKAAASVWNCGDTGAPTTNCTTGNAIVEVDGKWSWGELADQKSSPQKNCAGRYGVGWSVDWWGMSASKTPATISGLQGTTVTAATKSNAPAASWGSLTPGGVWQVKSNKLFFHTSALYNGFVADLCHQATPTSTGPVGDFSAVAVYPTRDAVPPKLCVNFYDPHGKEYQWSTSQNDSYASQDGDNSIQTNDFDPSTVSGNCLVPQDVNPPQNPGSPHLVVGKSGPATGTAGGTGTYTITLTNDGDAPTSGATSFVDMLPVGESFQSVDAANSDTGMSCQANAQNARQVDCSYADPIAAHASKSVAVVIGYAANTGGKSLKDCAGLMPAGATACVTTFIPKPGALDLAIVKTASASGVKTNDTLTYTLQVTNISDQPTTGTVTVTDTVPGGLSIVGTPSGSGWTCGAVAAAVTCTLDNPPLAAGQAAAPITVTTQVLPAAAGFVVNTGVVSTPGDVNPANNRSTVRTPVTKVLGTKIVKTPAKVAPARATRTPSVLPFTGWNTSTAITIGLALLVAGLRLINLSARRKSA